MPGRVKKIPVTGQVIQLDEIDSLGVPDDYWFETAEAHRFQIVGPPGCQGFVGSRVQVVKQATIVVV